MIQRYHVPANPTATFPATLTENLSHSPLAHAAFQSRRPQTADRRPQTADRRPQTADRRPQTADRRPLTYSHQYIIALIIAIVISTNLVKAQAPAGWDYALPPGGAIHGSICNPPGTIWWLGYTGIRTNAPQVPLHIYSGVCNVEDPIYDPAVLRLQTNNDNFAFGQSSIQFWSGDETSIWDWHVGSIKPITNSTYTAYDGTAGYNWKGGLSFSCSGTGIRPIETDEIEVMRLYDQRVVINSTLAKGRFDIRTGIGNYNPRFVFGTINVGENQPALKIYVQESSGLGEFGSSYPLWMTLEPNAPSSIGTSQFHIRSSPTSLGLGLESTSNVPERLTVTGNGNVGINQTVPDAKFQVSNGTVLFDGTTGGVPKKWTNTPPWTSSELRSGTRLMWIPEKAAFRAGEIITGMDAGLGLINQWADYNIGRASIATGQNCLANTIGGGAMGMLSTVRGSRWYSIPVGDVNMDNERESITHDDANSAHASFAFGHHCRVDSNIDCMTAGFHARIDGLHSRRSFAFGENVKIQDAATSFVFGSGNSQDDHSQALVNAEPFSMMVGFQSTGPALFVAGGQISSANTSRVGIGITDPLNRLDVNGAAIIGSNANNYSGVSFAPTNGLIVEGQTVLGGTAASSGFILTINGSAIALGSSPVWTTSDRNLKKDITNFTDGLATIRQINTVRFHYNGTLGIDSSEEHIGIIAQDIEKIAPYSVRMDTLITRKAVTKSKYVETDEFETFDGITRTKLRYEPAEIHEEKNTFLAYNPSDVQYIAINAIKQLDSTVSKLESQLQSLTSATTSTQIPSFAKGTDPYSSLEQRIKILEENILQIQATCCKNANLYDDVLLEQNAPNPFAKETIITYFVPERLSGRIELIISDISGNTVLQKVPVQPNIPTQYSYTATDLQTGVYLYSISVNGQLVKSKKMMVIK